MPSGTLGECNVNRKDAPPMILLIHKRRSDLKTGTVTDREGRVVGRVFKDTRLAAGTCSPSRRQGVRLPFWTVVPQSEAWPYGGASLGTRYVTRRQAVNALRHYLLSGMSIIEWQAEHRDGPQASHPMNRGLELTPAWLAARAGALADAACARQATR